MSEERKALWIWYPGDFEVWLHSEVSLRRRERGRLMPPFWRMDTSYHSILFRKRYFIEKPEIIRIYAEAEYTLAIDWQTIYCDGPEYTLPAGEHEITVNVVNRISTPSLFVTGDSVMSDNTWEVTHNRAQWHKAGCWTFDDASKPPSGYRLNTLEVQPVNIEHEGSTALLDFGKEIFAYLKLSGISGEGQVDVYYGESINEANSTEKCETLDKIIIKAGDEEVILPEARAFRFVRLVWEKSTRLGGINALYEYLPLTYKGSFSCSNDTLNEIWNTAAYTLHLNTREFMLDGIKRDRWVWCGDAYQSFLMNYYLFFDEAVNERTLVALRGKEPVEAHINGIMDYSFYWFLSLFDYYLYTGKSEFVRQNYSKMLSLMDFCLKRRNKNSMLEGYPEDWIFIDWADMDKRGEVSTEQILFFRSLEVMAFFAGLFEDKDNEARFQELASELRLKIMDKFWDDEQGGFIQNFFEGELKREITVYPNMFAILFGYLDAEKAEKVKKCVLMNPGIERIKTPYMRFHELSALCELGEQSLALDEIIGYWGSMLKLGATTFWEEFNPELSGDKHFEMYGRPFGKSLCHAWGASPIYLLGRYFLGVKPLTKGYETYIAEPVLGGLEWMKGTVPLPDGQIEIYMDKSNIRMKSSKGKGYLKIKGSVLEILPERYYDIKLDDI
jgi:hypothetical protein